MLKIRRRTAGEPTYSEMVGEPEPDRRGRKEERVSFGSTQSGDDKAKEQEESKQSESKPLTAEDAQFIGSLAEIWGPHEEKGLPLRHQMGLIIIAKLQELEQDQERGRFVLQHAADRLGMNLSDLSRMRAFATEFKTFDEFVQAHPTVKVWSQVKTLLATIRAARKKPADTPTTTATKKSTDKERDAAVRELKAIKDFIAATKEEFNIKQAADVEQFTEEIRNELAELAAPLKKLAMDR